MGLSGNPGGTGPVDSAQTGCYWRRIGLNHHGLLEEETGEWSEDKLTQTMYVGKHTIQNAAKCREGQSGTKGNLYLSVLSITAVTLNKLPTIESLIDVGWFILAGPWWPRLLVRDRAPPQLRRPYYSAIYITEYHSSKPAPPPPPLWACSYETQLDLFAMRAEKSRADRDMIISSLIAAGKIKGTNNWIT